MGRRSVRHGIAVGTVVYLFGAIAVGVVTDVAFQGVYESLSSPIEIRYWGIVFVSGLTAGIAGRAKQARNTVVQGTMIASGLVLLIAAIGVTGTLILQAGARFGMDPLRAIGTVVMGPTPIEWWYHSGLNPRGSSPAPATAVFIVVVLAGSLLGPYLGGPID